VTNLLQFVAAAAMVAAGVVVIHAESLHRHAPGAWFAVGMILVISGALWSLPRKQS
jgi:hypothetical protein